MLGECTQIGYVPKRLAVPVARLFMQKNPVVAQVPVERGGDAVLGKYTEASEGEVQAVTRYVRRSLTADCGTSLMREVQAVMRYVRRSLTADCGISKGCKRFCKYNNCVALLSLHLIVGILCVYSPRCLALQWPSLEVSYIHQLHRSVADPPFQPSYYGFIVQLPVSYLSVFVAIVI